LFRRRKDDEAAAAAAREAERRALFAELARRPDNVCPFLALADDRVAYRDEPSDDHRCYAFGDPAPLSDEQQSRVCLQRGYGNCPRYLRGILVIPTEELEALRHPQPMPAPPPPPAVDEPARRRRAPLLLVGVLALLLLVGGGAAYLMSNNNGVAVVPSSPSPTPATAAPTSVVSASPTPSSASVTPPPSPTPEPTPTAGDVFDHYEVSVAPGSYTIFHVDSSGNLTDPRIIGFDNYSQAIVRLVESPRRSWLVQNGPLVGYSYVADDSGPFRIRRVYLSPSGERRADYLTQDER
jgi:hypothetical protein